MKDFLGRTVKEGDHVVYHTAGRYGDLKKAVVVGFTPKMVKLEVPGKYRELTRVYSYSLIKYDPETLNES